MQRKLRWTQRAARRLGAVAGWCAVAMIAPRHIASSQTAEHQAMMWQTWLRPDYVLANDEGLTPTPSPALPTPTAPLPRPRLPLVAAGSLLRCVVKTTPHYAAMQSRAAKPYHLIYTWCASGPGGSGSFANGRSSAAIWHAPTGTQAPGTYRLTCTVSDTTSGTHSKPIVTRTLTAQVFGVDHLEFQTDRGWQRVYHPFYVMTGTTVNFRAVPTIKGAKWPPHQPVWSGITHGTGATQRITFDKLSSYVPITATCGPTVTAPAAVYTLIPLFMPVDDFPGRTYKAFGIGEEIELSVIITTDPTLVARADADISPASLHVLAKASTSGGAHPVITPKEIGGLEWVLESGDGKLVSSPKDDGTGHYTAGDGEGQFNLTVRIKDNPIELTEQPAPKN